MADLLQFTGMLATDLSSFLRRPDQLLEAINVHGDTVGILESRRGYSQYGGTLSAGNSVKGLYTYCDVSGGSEYLYTFANGTIFYNPSTWQSIVGSLLSDANMEFAEFLDQLFVCGANSSGSFLTTANIDSGVYSTSTNVSNAPKARYVEVYKDRVYLANCDGFPDRFYYSGLPDTAGTAITWSSDDYERVYTNNGEEITGMHNNKVLNELLFFKWSSMHAWDTYRLRDVANIGTTAHRSIKTVNAVTFFFNQSGIYAYSGGYPQRISRIIQKWIDAVTDPTAVFAEVEDGVIYKLYIGNVTVDGESFTNCEIRYSTIDNTFSIYSYYDTFTCYAQHTISNIGRVYGGTSDGVVHQFALKTDAVYEDDGQAIFSRFMFETDLGLPSARKSVDKVLIYSELAQNMAGRVRPRGGDWYSEFGIDTDEYETNINHQDGRFLQFQFTSASSVEPFRFLGLTINPHITSG